MTENHQPCYMRNTRQYIPPSSLRCDADHGWKGRRMNSSHSNMLKVQSFLLGHRGVGNGQGIAKGNGRLQAVEARYAQIRRTEDMQGHVNLPFAIGSHRSCSFTSNSPWPCACVSWFSLSMCSGSSPDCASGSTSGSFGGEAEDMILGVWVRAADTGLRRGSFGMLCWQMTTSEVREKDLCSKGYAALRQGASDWAAICFTIARTWELPTVWGKWGSSSVLFCSAQLRFGGVRLR